MKVERRGDTAARELIDRQGGACQRVFAVTTVNDQLADHGIVERRYGVGLVGVAVDAHPLAHRRQPRLEHAGRRHEIPPPVLGVDAKLDGVPARRIGKRYVTQRLAACDAQLQLDQVQSEDLLRHRVLDLDPGVHLDEVEALLLRRVDELDRARADVAYALGQRDRGFVQLLSHLLIERRGRRFLHQLLVAALDGAVALTEMHHVAMAIAEDLNLDMAHLGKEPLEIDRAIAEGGFRLPIGLAEESLERVRIVGDAHAAPATPRARLEQHRKADFRRRLAGDAGIVKGGIGAGHHRHAEPGGRLARLRLVTHEADGFRRGADESQTFRLAGLGECRVLGEETVPRIDGVAAPALGDMQQRGNVQIALRRGRRPDADRVVRNPAMGRIAIGLGIDRGGFNSQSPADAGGTQGDLAPVGDEKMLHVRYPLPARPHGMKYATISPQCKIIYFTGWKFDVAKRPPLRSSGRTEDAAKDEGTPPVPLSFKEVAEILTLIDASECDEVILEIEGTRLVVRRNASGTPQTGVTPSPGATPAMSGDGDTPADKAQPRTSQAQPQQAEAASSAEPGITEVRAPMVGTFYGRPSPDEDAFVTPGTVVKKGDPLCLIEVMKLFTTIEAPADGTIMSIAVEDGTLVEFNQLLFRIDT